MGHPASRILPTVSASLLAGLLFLPVTADAADAVAQQLTAPRASEKVAAVLWTRRADRYTLQIVFPRSSRVMGRVDGRKLDPNGPNPEVTLWLLGEDGTVISVSREQPLGAGPPSVPAEAAYSVSLASGERAVAAAIRIDDAFFIEPLQALNSK